MHGINNQSHIHTVAAAVISWDPPSGETAMGFQVAIETEIFQNAYTQILTRQTSKY